METMKQPQQFASTTTTSTSTQQRSTNNTGQTDTTNSTKQRNDAYISELFSNLTNDSNFYESYISLLNSNNIIRWKCNLHYSSKQKCELALLNYTFLVHIILNVKEINLRTKNFARICNKFDRDEFWERLTYTYEINKPFVYLTMCISSLKNCDLKRERSVMENVFALFDKLDENNYKYSHDNTPRDFVESHIVVNNFAGVQLCNTHLLMSTQTTSSSSTTTTAAATGTTTTRTTTPPSSAIKNIIQPSNFNSFPIQSDYQQQQNKKLFYSRAIWKKNILMELFPQACNRKKNSIPTNTPDWVRALFDSLSVTRKKRKISTAQNVYY